MHLPPRSHPPQQPFDAWRVAKTIKPHQRGAIKLSRRHGPALVCVRYREHPNGTERLTTIELVVERVMIQKRIDPVVWFKLYRQKEELQRHVKAHGGRYDGRRRLWSLLRSHVIRLGLEDRIAAPIDDHLV